MIAKKIIFGDNLVVADQGSGIIRVDGFPHPTSVIGPYPLEAADFPVDNTRVELFDPEIGKIITNIWIDVSTLVPFDLPNSPFGIGQNVSFSGGNYWFNLPGLQTFNAETAMSLVANGSYALNNSTMKSTEIRVTTDDPVEALIYFAGSSAPTVGHMDLFFQITTPSAPS